MIDIINEHNTSDEQSAFADILEQMQSAEPAATTEPQVLSLVEQGYETYPVVGTAVVCYLLMLNRLFEDSSKMIGVFQTRTFQECLDFYHSELYGDGTGYPSVLPIPDTDKSIPFTRYFKEGPLYDMTPVADIYTTTLSPDMPGVFRQIVEVNGLRILESDVAESSLVDVGFGDYDVDTRVELNPGDLEEWDGDDGEPMIEVDNTSVIDTSVIDTSVIDTSVSMAAGHEPMTAADAGMEATDRGMYERKQLYPYEGGENPVAI
jgi:hypothetical protein